MSPSTAPAAATLTAEVTAQIETAAHLLRGRVVAVLTGAGVSTDSGIPDYRGEGAPVRVPMSFQQFLGDLEFRKRYWAGSQLGWERFEGALPNEGHRALVGLEVDGVVNGIVTQNVDGLHLRAGSRRVVDLHGTMDRVRCLQCGQLYARSDIGDRIAALNPWLSGLSAVDLQPNGERQPNGELGPDGDVAIASVAQFIIPECTVCGGMLKPDIVYFGEYIPREKFIEATALVSAASALLIAGSSLVVNSGIRLLEQASRRRKPIVIINRGATKGDPRAALKIDAGTSETLTALREQLAR
jgi:NAD-dependent SIR2 family protein deacetylase